MSKFIVAMLLVLGSSGLALAEVTTHVTEPLKRKQGYLLIDLDLESPVAKIELVRGASGRSSAVASAFRRKTEIGPFATGRHLLLLPLDEGNYVWGETHVPRYDLPFLVDTADDKRWSFTIERSRINYLGQLSVRKERSAEVVRLGLNNRIAMTIRDIRQTFAEELSQWPLRYAGYYPDRFFEEFIDADGGVNSP